MEARCLALITENDNVSDDPIHALQGSGILFIQVDDDNGKINHQQRIIKQ